MIEQKRVARLLYAKEESDFHWAVARILREDMAPMRAFSSSQKLKLRFGLDEIGEDIYKTSIAHLNTELAEIERVLETASINLSNMEKFVDRAMLMCCQLGDLWIDGDFESRQELQKMVFPSGIFLDKENCNYRTILLSQTSNGKLAYTLPWREIVGTANK